MTEPDELPYKKRNYRLSERGKRIILVIVSVAALIAVLRMPDLRLLYFGQSYRGH